MSDHQCDVFISYKREERQLADILEDALVSKGYRVVSDSHIGPSQDFGDAIDGMIRSAKCVLVVWTSASMASQWVKSEALLASQLGTYLGILAEPVSLRVDFNSVQSIDAITGGIESNIEKIIASVKIFIGDPVYSPSSASSIGISLRDELIYFQSVEAIGSADAYRSYLQSFPDGKFSDVAVKKAKDIEGSFQSELYDEFREIARLTIREELQGPIGQQISRKVKKVIRDEIEKAGKGG
ncbi:MAG: toll/interleukin-1 receptor domain-containing protein [Pseudomonadota bacterium]